ncbi:MAG: ABC transporter permease [Paracoccaceae bacterium]
MSAGTRAPLAPVLAAMASHWRRNPVQLAALLIGLAAATALWSGVQALNAEARASYDRAAEAVGGGAARLVPSGADSIGQSLWVDLRRAGWPVSPVVEGEVEIAGETVRLLGVEPLSLPEEAGVSLGDPQGSGMEGGDGAGFAAFVRPPFRALAAPSTLDRLGVTPGEEPRLANGGRLPPLARVPTVAGGAVVVDIGVAQRLLGMDGRLSYVLLGDREGPRTPLAEVAGDRLRLVEPRTSEDLDRLTRSFHMNLTAFGLLSFVVGLFIVHAAIGLAFEQRRVMFRTLRACGIAARTLAGALLAEILAIALVAGTLGLVGGYLIAAWLLPDVAASVRGLYGAEVGSVLAIRPAWFLAGLVMAVAGALAAAGQSLWRAYRLPVLAGAGAQAWAEDQRRWLNRQGLLALAVAVVTALLPVVLGGLTAGFAMLAGITVAAALALPLVLATVIGLAERIARPGLARWFWADGRQQIGGLSLALMALLLALGVNIGVGTMVGSFRVTFTDWIEDRLGADAYMRAEDEAEADRLLAWLDDEPAVKAVLPNWSAETAIDGWPVEVFGVEDDPLYRETWPLIDAAPDLWDRLFAGRAVLISEQMHYRLDLDIGDTLALPTPSGEWPVEVAGVYADYGNPKGQVRIAVDQLTGRFPGVERLSYGLRIEDGERRRVIDAMGERFGLGLDQLRDQRSIQELSLSIFERTFVVTGALNTLTLGVAGVALLTSLVTLAGLRLPQLAPVWAMGLTRAQLGGLELAKTVSLALVTALCALPLGLAIAWLLLTIVNVEAFGWRLPLHLFPLDWARLIARALAVAALATALPMWRLVRMAPARLVAVFAQAR